jgi:cobalt transporter subunit CbtB
MARILAPVSTPASAAVGTLRRAAILAALFGGVLIWGVGFAQPMAIHNAAHDARHSIAFPCH